MADTEIVTCVGETMVAFSPTGLTSLQDAAGLDMAFAGAESNVAMYLADLGVRARWVSRVGDDPFGRFLRAKVSAGGVDVSAVEIDEVRQTGVMFKDPAPSGTTVHYYRKGSAASAMSPDMARAIFSQPSRLLHLSGVTPALSDSCADLMEFLIAGPHRQESTVSFDVNLRPKLWGHDPAATLLRHAERCDIVFIGLDEAQALWNCEDANAVRRAIAAPDCLVVKDGSHGATVFARGQAVFVPSPEVDVVEPVGAGDAFAAGFLAAWLRNEPPVRALRSGHLTAASALVVSGDHGPVLPTDRYEQLLNCDDASWSVVRLSAANFAPTRAAVGGESV